MALLLGTQTGCFVSSGFTYVPDRHTQGVRLIGGPCTSVPYAALHVPLTKGVAISVSLELPKASRRDPLLFITFVAEPGQSIRLGNSKLSVHANGTDLSEQVHFEDITIQHLGTGAPPEDRRPIAEFVDPGIVAPSRETRVNTKAAIPVEGTPDVEVLLPPIVVNGSTFQVQPITFRYRRQTKTVGIACM